MTLHSGTGTGTGYADSLAESIEAAVAGELFALREAKLPETGIEDRRMLFSAIARGVLQHLAANPPDLQVPLPDFLDDPLSPPLSGETTVVNVLSPSLTVSGGSVEGTGWPPSLVTVTLVRTGEQQAGDRQTVSGTTFSLSFGGMQKGDIVDARDGDGRAAQAVVS